MLAPIRAFSSFSVKDLEAAKHFYTEILELKLEDETMGLHFALPGGGHQFIYPKADHEPAVFTVLSFAVEDIDSAVQELAAKGVKFERYPEMEQDEKGIMRGLKINRGPDIAWFKDPGGNILAVLQDS